MPATITADYIKEQLKLHEDPLYGAGSHRYVHLLNSIIKSEQCNSVLDYGAGKGTLAAEFKKLGVVVSEYDPCICGKDQRPEPADLVTCIDVMEHIEPACLDAVMKDLVYLSRKRLFVDVATKFDKHRWLSDGRNSHQIVNGDAWWMELFAKYGFSVLKSWQTGMKAWIALMVAPHAHS